MRQYNSVENVDFAEGVASFVEKRLPAFEPLPASWALPDIPAFAPQE